MNTRLLGKVRDTAMKFPEHMDMTTITGGKEITFKNSSPTYRTVGCIAGWALAISYGSFSEQYAAESTIEKDAAEVLDISFDPIDPAAQSLRLFRVQHWPKRFEERWLEEDDRTPECAQVIADRIDFFIKTNGTDKE